MNDEYEYDVALSFAGEDRDFVEKVALELSNRKLNEKNVRVFYDAYEQHNLWGDDLYQKLANVYQKQARFVIFFVSRHSAIKPWTKHELRNAQARALIEESPYILPARFDDTEIPGLPPTIGYIDLRAITDKEFVDLIISKLKSKPSSNFRPSIKISQVTIFLHNFPYGKVKVYCDEKIVAETSSHQRDISIKVTQGLHAIKVYFEGELRTDGRGISRRTYGESEKKILQFSDEKHYFKCEFPEFNIFDIFGIVKAIFTPYPTEHLLLYSTEVPIKK